MLGCRDLDVCEENLLAVVCDGLAQNSEIHAFHLDTFKACVSHIDCFSRADASAIVQQTLQVSLHGGVHPVCHAFRPPLLASFQFCPCNVFVLVSSYIYIYVCVCVPADSAFGITSLSNSGERHQHKMSESWLHFSISR